MSHEIEAKLLAIFASQCNRRPGRALGERMEQLVIASRQGSGDKTFVRNPRNIAKGRSFA